MKIAVAAAGSSLDAPLDPRFGRCAWFVVVDSETMACEAVENPGAQAGGGAGVMAAQAVAGAGAEAVVCGWVGPHAQQALSAAGIRVYSLENGTVREAVAAAVAGKLAAQEAPTAPARAGMSAAQTPAPTAQTRPGRGKGGAGQGRQQGFRGGRTEA